jgi:hypothetical protein
MPWPARNVSSKNGSQYVLNPPRWCSVRQIAATPAAGQQRLFDELVECR